VLFNDIYMLLKTLCDQLMFCNIVDVLFNIIDHKYVVLRLEYVL